MTNNCGGITIDEYGYAGQYFYDFSYFNSFGYEELFDADGIMLCAGFGIGFGNDTCGWVPEAGLERVRRIWSELDE